MSDIPELVLLALENVGSSKQAEIAGRETKQKIPVWLENTFQQPLNRVWICQLGTRLLKLADIHPSSCL